MSNQVITKEQMETLENFESYYRHCLKPTFEYIEERLINDKDVKLDDRDYQKLSFLKYDLENLFSVFITEEE